jgi:hypothetical protein
MILHVFCLQALGEIEIKRFNEYTHMFLFVCDICDTW